MSETIDAVTVAGPYHRLALGADGRVHVAYRDVTVGDLRYAVRATSGTWTTETVAASPASDGHFPEVEVDAMGVVHLADLDEDAEAIRYHRKAPNGSFETTNDVGTGAATRPSLAVQSDGTAHLAYHTQDQLGISRLPAGGGSWSHETVAVDSPWPPSTRSVVEDTGRLHVLFRTYTGIGADTDLEYYASGGGDAELDMVSPLGNTIGSHALALGDDGSVHAAFPSTLSQRLTYAYRDPADGAFTVEELEVNVSPSDDGGAVGIDVDDDGAVHLVYFVFQTDAGGYAYRAPDGTWSFESNGAEYLKPDLSNPNLNVPVVDVAVEDDGTVHVVAGKDDLLTYFRRSCSEN